MRVETKEERTERLAILKEIKEKLKECRPEWLEKNAKQQDSLGVWTVQQILDYATGGAWDFVIEEQWREDVQKYDKNSRQYHFDGYVYHVRGYLYIEGLGRRSQYGSKVAIGGKDNQNSSYKAAASDCLKKCASLFGVGSSIYSKIKIEEDEYTQVQNDQNYMVGNQQQQQQQTGQNVTYVNQFGDHQQGEYVWFNNQWMHQSEYYTLKQQQTSQPTNGGQYPSPGLTEEQQKTQFYYDTMKQYDPQGYEQMKQTAGPSPLEQSMQAADQAVAAGEINYPFNQTPVSPGQPSGQQEFQAQPQAEAAPQAEATQQSFQAVEYGAPVEPQKSEAAPKKEEDPLAHIQAENPWNTLENQQSIEMFRQHKERLGIQKDQDLLPHVREFFKDEKASIASITPEVLVSFNDYLKNIAV